LWCWCLWRRIECRPHFLKVLIEAGWKDVTRINQFKLCLADEYRWTRVIVQVRGFDRFHWRARKYAALHRRVDRSRLVTIERAGGVLHRGAEVLVQIGRRGKYVPVLREVGEVYAERGDDRAVRLRETLPSLHRFHVGGQAADRVLDKRHRVDSEDAQDEIDACDRDSNPTAESDSCGQRFGKA
jgi:hypothetical protein